MKNKSLDFSPEELARLASSPAAKQLLELLQGSDPETFSAAKDRASSGDYAGAIAALKKLTSGAEAKSLLKQLEDTKHG